MKILLPFSSPTTVAIIDDNYETLNQLKHTFDPSLATYAAFDNPFIALDFINQNIHKGKSSLHFPSGESLLSGNIESPYEQIYKTARFEQISTVIVDYDMPGMNGIKFCQSINSPHIQKIILTGATSEKLAIEAFNAKAIDYFIQKSDTQVIEKLETLIYQAQASYFSSLNHQLTSVISYDSLDLLGITDPSFIDFFQQFIKEKNICEYYILDSIGSFLFLSAKGEVSALFVFDDLSLMSQQELIPESERDNKLAQEIYDSKKAICYYPFKGLSDYDPLKWKDFVFPLVPLEGRQRYYWAYVPALPYLDTRKIITFNQYQHSLKNI